MPRVAVQMMNIEALCTRMDLSPVNFPWVIDFLDVLTALIMSLPEASRARADVVITRPARIVAAGSSTIASAIPGWSSNRLSKWLVENAKTSGSSKESRRSSNLLQQC